jgi:hypothetical protein
VYLEDDIVIMLDELVEEFAKEFTKTCSTASQITRAEICRKIICKYVKETHQRMKACSTASVLKNAS